MSETDRRDEIREIKVLLLRHTGLLSGHLINLNLSSDNEQREIKYIKRQIDTIISKLSLINEDFTEETEEEIDICIDMGKEFAVLTERDSILSEKSSIDEWAIRVNALKLIPSDSEYEGRDEESILKLAEKGLDKILRLSDSQLISEKLQAFNMLLFVFIITICLTYYLDGASKIDLSTLFAIAISFLLALIANLGYGPLLSVVADISENKIQPLRIGIAILFIALTSSIASFTLNISGLMVVALVLTFIQLIIIPIIGLSIPETSVKDIEIDINQLWANVGKVANIVGIITGLLDIGLILYSLM